MFRRLTLSMALGALLVMPRAAQARQGAAPAPGVAPVSGVATGSAESHLFFAATARSLPAGHGYFSLREFGLGAFQVGVTDRLSFGAGTVIFYPKAVVLTPKYQVYRSQTLSAAVGVAHLTQFQKEKFGAAYGVVTREYRSGSVTGGVGLLYARGSDFSAGAAVAMIGGERRVSPHVDVVTENYVFFQGGTLTSVGVRMGRGRFTSELGAIVLLIPDGPVAGPIINFGWKF